MTRYSTTAEFRLFAGEPEREFPVAQVAPLWLLMDCALAVPLGPAVLEIRVAGETIRRQIEVTGQDGGRIDIVRGPAQ